MSAAPDEFVTVAVPHAAMEQAYHTAQEIGDTGVHKALSEWTDEDFAAHQDRRERLNEDLYNADNAGEAAKQDLDEAQAAYDQAVEAYDEALARLQKFNIRGLPHALFADADEPEVAEGGVSHTRANRRHL